MITVDIEEYKLFASISGDKTNTQLESLLQESASIVENYVGQEYEVEIDNEDVYLRTGRNTYFVDDADAVQDTLTLVRRVAKKSETLTMGTDFLIIDGSIRLLDVEFADFDTLKVDYGRELREANPDLKMAVMLLTQYYYKQEYARSSASVAGQSSKIDANESTSLPNRVRALLDFHRIL